LTVDIGQTVDPTAGPADAAAAIISGSLIHLPVERGQEVSARIAGLGQVTVLIGH